MVKILLVEDDKSLREIYGVRLLAEGYDIVSAGDGEEALAMAIKDRPDLIVSDVMMPKISGFDMLDILRSTTETKGIKVIMMTALSSEEQRQRGVALGADRYLVKSQVGIEDVVRTVHEVLGDAPVTGIAPQPIVSASASTPMPPVPVGGPAPIAPAVPMPQPIAAPAPAPVAPTPIAPTPIVMQPTPVVSMPTPIPVASQPSPAPTPAPMPAPTPTEPILPQPSAPFSTPRTTGNTLADRVIQPLNTTSQAPNFGNLMNQELGQAQAPTTSGISYEETPQSPSPLPTPPQPPQTGV